MNKKETEDGQNRVQNALIEDTIIALKEFDLDDLDTLNKAIKNNDDDSFRKLAMKRRPTRLEKVHEMTVIELFNGYMTNQICHGDISSYSEHIEKIVKEHSRMKRRH